MEEITFTPIGVIETPFDSPEGMPIQPAGARDVTGEAIIFDEYLDGLKDLEGFSHVILLYHFHKSRRYDLQVTPFLDEEKRGLFATRAPNRPNGIGLSIVELMAVEGNRLQLRGTDMLNRSPLLDIKPYVPAFDAHPDAKTGWLARSDADISRLSDDRFR